MNTIKHIRTQVFGASQKEFSEIAGVNQGTISKWEAGGRDPDLSQLSKIRSEALKRGLPWDDSLFFQGNDSGHQERNDELV